MQTNPFATRYIQPGAIRYEFFGKGSIDDLISRLLGLPGRRGLIVGPHGSGKSTLIATLKQEIPNCQPTVSVYHSRFSSDVPALRTLRLAKREWRNDSLAILDGYEQLGWWARWGVNYTIRKRNMRLLATAHQPMRGMVVLWKTSVDEVSSQWVVEQLLNNPETKKSAMHLLASNEWHRSRKNHGQNLRESLFDMYDWWQKNSDGFRET